MCKILRYLAISIVFYSFHANSLEPQGLINYGAPQQIWLNKFRAIAQGQAGKFRIIQLGDSHTAGDFFSDSIRKTLQNRYGNGGIGWIYPNKVSGQRDATVSYESSGWLTSSSRREEGDFPLGGVITQSNGKGELRVVPEYFSEDTPSTIILVAKTNNPMTHLYVRDNTGSALPINATNEMPNQWFYTYFKATPPLYLYADSAWTLGPINIENIHSGIVYSAMGINGARLSDTQKWRSQWLTDLQRTKADLVILAYGTNEAFDSPFDQNAVANIWQQRIQQIQQVLPDAGILIIGAPESLKSATGQCGTRAVSLDAIQQIQQYIASSNATLYWSWQEAMGGGCSMKSWITQKLGRKDGIHFTREGYEQAGMLLANALIDLVENTK